ncbi:MAG: ABC transporter permease/substrate-binding protein [Vicinamibacterales bacterium]
MRVLEFWRSHAGELVSLLGQHVFLVAVSTLAAVVLGVPIGLLAAKRPRLGAPVVWLANVAQTIPSLAMFGFLLPLPWVGGLGARVAITVLVLYALLPIIRTTMAGMRSIDPSLVEAGLSLGMTPGQLFRRVELPLALPSIVAGIRVATVIGVGTATIAAAVGAGGLGEYIFRGLSMVEPTVILAGAVPAALLALSFDGGLMLLERGIRRAIESGGSRRLRVLVAAAALIVAVGGGVAVALMRPDSTVIRVGSKNFTEQILLGELLAQTIERDSGLKVDCRLNLGGTFICDQALRSGDIDLYVEYSGTALTAVFHQPVETDPARVLEAIRGRYAQVGVTLLAPLGFENTFAILVRGQDAASLGLSTIGDAAGPARNWRAGFGYEFLQRADGYPGLAKAYGLQFGTAPRAMDLSLIYRALADRQVDLIAGDATSGLIEAYGLTMLKDDRRYFPPYDAVPVARAATLLAHPEVKTALATLAGNVSVADMRRLNRAVDAERQDPAAVVRAFLQTVPR